MKAYQKVIAGISIGLCVGLLDYLTPKYPKSQWEYYETSYSGLNFYKRDKDKNIETVYRVCFTGSSIIKENPSIELSIHKLYSKITTGGYVTNEHITIMDNSYGKNKVDGNINWFFLFHKDLLPLGYSYIEFDDNGDVLSRRGNFEKYSNRDIQKILKFANQKLKDIRYELRGKFGDKIEIPYENESIEKVLDEFE